MPALPARRPAVVGPVVERGVRPRPQPPAVDFDTASHVAPFRALYGEFEVQ